MKDNKARVVFALLAMCLLLAQIGLSGRAYGQSGNLTWAEMQKINEDARRRSEERQNSRSWEESARDAMWGMSDEDLQSDLAKFGRNSPTGKLIAEELKKRAAQKQQEEREEKDFQEWEKKWKEGKVFGLGLEDVEEDEGWAPFQGIKNWVSGTTEKATSSISNAVSDSATKAANAVGDKLLGGISDAVGQTWGTVKFYGTIVLVITVIALALWFAEKVKKIIS